MGKILDFPVLWEYNHNMEENKFENSSETKNDKKPPKALVFVAIIIFVLGLAIYLIFAVGDGGTTNYLTYANFTKIQNGMSYSEVVSILGNHEGTLDTTA